MESFMELREKIEERCRVCMAIKSGGIWFKRPNERLKILAMFMPELSRSALCGDCDPKKTRYHL